MDGEQYALVRAVTVFECSRCETRWHGTPDRSADDVPLCHDCGSGDWVDDLPESGWFDNLPESDDLFEIEQEQSITPPYVRHGSHNRHHIGIMDPSSVILCDDSRLPEPRAMVMPPLVFSSQPNDLETGGRMTGAIHTASMRYDVRTRDVGGEETYHRNSGRRRRRDHHHHDYQESSRSHWANPGLRRHLPGLGNYSETREEYDLVELQPPERSQVIQEIQINTNINMSTNIINVQNHGRPEFSPPNPRQPSHPSQEHTRYNTPPREKPRVMELPDSPSQSPGLNPPYRIASQRPDLPFHHGDNGKVMATSGQNALADVKLKGKQLEEMRPHWHEKREPELEKRHPAAIIPSARAHGLDPRPQQDGRSHTFEHMPNTTTRSAQETAGNRSLVLPGKQGEQPLASPQPHKHKDDQERHLQEKSNKKWDTALKSLDLNSQGQIFPSKGLAQALRSFPFRAKGDDLGASSKPRAPDTPAAPKQLLSPPKAKSLPAQPPKQPPPPPRSSPPAPLQSQQPLPPLPPTRSLPAQPPTEQSPWHSSNESKPSCPGGPAPASLPNKGADTRDSHRNNAAGNGEPKRRRGLLSIKRVAPPPEIIHVQENNQPKKGDTKKTEEHSNDWVTEKGSKKQKKAAKAVKPPKAGGLRAARRRGFGKVKPQKPKIKN